MTLFHFNEALYAAGLCTEANTLVQALKQIAQPVQIYSIQKYAYSMSVLHVCLK